MVEHHVEVLDEAVAEVGDQQRGVEQREDLAPVEAEHAGRPQPHLARHPDGVDDVRGVAAAGDDDEQVARAREHDELLR